MSYFDDHNCVPLSDGESPDHALHLARLLIDSGVSEQMRREFERLYGMERKLPASKQFIETLEKKNDFTHGEKCSICLKELVKDETVYLPCKHYFHSVCIKPWLNMHNSCPLCRTQFPTDDEEYEKRKKEDKRRHEMIDELHHSMFS